MIEIEEPGWDAPEQDNCGSMTYAVLKIDSISIPLCSDCLEYLEQSLNEYKSKVHCYQCRHFVCSKWGLKYGGSCKLSAKEAGQEITDPGYDKFSKYFDQYCDKGERE